MTSHLRLLGSALVACASASITAHAVTLNPKGLGQALIYPYYTVNKGQDTLLSIVNTSDLGSVNRVRFLEGMNGRPVLELTVFLSAHDVWTARVSQLAGDGGAAIFTGDSSCTYPALLADGTAFQASAYAGTSVYPADGGPTSVTRTREGMIELIQMGDVIPGSALDDEITHAQDGTPNEGTPHCDPTVVGGFFQFMAPPTGGVGGSASIVNVGEGTFFSYTAHALAGVTAVIMFTDNFPSLRYANSPDSSLNGGAVAHVVANGGKVIALDYPNGIDAVSAVFMADAIDNEYLTAAGLGANTDWVVTFPTKEFYVDPFYNATVVQPFHELFHAPGLSNVEVGEPSQVIQAIYDQEEGQPSPPAVIGPPTPGAPSYLSYQTNVISFIPDATGTPQPLNPGVLGSDLRATIAPYGDAGWLHLGLAEGDSMSHALRPAVDGSILRGLPVAGFMVYNIINANAAPGMLANYGGTFAHRTTLDCTATGSDTRACP